MKNQELSKIFYEIANYLEMEEIAFKPHAYKKVANILETLEEDVEKIYKKGGLKALEKIPGVGKNIALRIEEYLKTGRINYYEKLKKEIPINLEEIIAVEGMGPRKAKILYQKLGIKNLKDLERTAKAHKIASLFGFGETTEKNILEGIAFLKRSKSPSNSELYGSDKNVTYYQFIGRVNLLKILRLKKNTITGQISSSTTAI